MADVVSSEFDFVCLDCETTGLDSQKDEVVEITAIEYNLTGKVGKIITRMCEPMSGYIPQGATAVNGITFEMVKGKPNYLTGGIREEIAGFLGNRTASGHNIIEFDSKFMRIILNKVYDTLQVCRSRFNGGNKLKTACIRLNIKWDDKEAHRSEYDCLKTIELHCKLHEMAEKDRKAKEDLPMFAADAHVKEIYSQEKQLVESLIEIDASKEMKLGVLPSEKDKQLVSTQAYSYSRLNLFNQCPFKWYMQYIKGFKEPDRDYFQTGKICHKIAEWTGEYCYKQTFKNKLVQYLLLKKYNIPEDAVKQAREELSIQTPGLSLNDFAEYVYRKPAMICIHISEAKNIADLIYIIDKTVDENSYEQVSKPDLETYNKFVESAINYHKCSNPDVINEVRVIAARFYAMKDFSTMPGELSLTEKHLVFDRSWKSLNDFYSHQAFFRGIIDIISYIGDCVIITDYKSSRKMMSLKDLKEDRQTMTYVLLVCMFLPKGSFRKIIVRIEYLRFGETIEYEITNPDEVCGKALSWINSTIQNIEQEMLKTDGTAFHPSRNEYCHTCFLGEDGACPLFNKNISGRLDDPFNCSVATIEECQAAWKRIETNVSENARLSKLCKSFTEKCQDPIFIDKNAKLDFYLSKYRDYDTKATVVLLLKKGFKMEEFINYFSISASKLKDFLEEKGAELKEEELNSISKIKSKYTFDAYTKTEAQSKGCINA
jgi:DNA polymerase III epsilon subunit-like protein